MENKSKVIFGSSIFGFLNSKTDDEAMRNVGSDEILWQLPSLGC